MDEQEIKAIAPETQEEKPEWMSIEDWEVVESLPISARASAITMRQKMMERRDQESVMQAELIKGEVGKATGPEQTHLAILAPERLEPLERRLPIMQRCRRDVDGHLRRSHQLPRAPLAIFPPVADMAIGVHVGKTQAVPINLLHRSSSQNLE